MMNEKGQNVFEILEKFKEYCTGKTNEVQELNQKLHEFFKLDMQSLITDNMAYMQSKITEVETNPEKIFKELLLIAFKKKLEEANQKDERELENLGLEVGDITKVQDIIHELEK